MDSTTVQILEGELAASLLDWVRDSLGAGLEVATRVLGLIDSRTGVIRVIGPPKAQLVGKNPRWSIGIVQASADAALLPFVQALPDARTVLVEDELMVQVEFGLNRELEDESRWAKVSFIGEQVIWWLEVDARAVELIELGSAGYPRNTFLLSDTPESLGSVIANRWMRGRSSRSQLPSLLSSSGSTTTRATSSGSADPRPHRN